MPSISQKGQLMPASPIRKLVPYAEAAKKRGTKVLHLNIGQPDIRTPEVALQAIRHTDLQVVEYSHSAGIESYRKGLAAYYQDQGIDITHEQLIVTTGGSEALLFGMMACFDPGDEIIIPRRQGQTPAWLTNANQNFASDGRVSSSRRLSPGIISRRTSVSITPSSETTEVSSALVTRAGSRRAGSCRSRARLSV